MFEYMKNVMIDIMNLGFDLIILLVLLLILTVAAVIAARIDLFTARQEKVLIVAFIGMVIGIVTYGTIGFITPFISPSNTPKIVTYDRNIILDMDHKDRELPPVIDLTPQGVTDQERSERFEEMVRWKR